MMKVAEGAVSSTVDILKTLKEKVINAANDTNTDADRATIQKELDQSIDQINDNANVTYNGKYLVDGSKSASVTQTTTAMTNESLNSTTAWDTALTSMKDRNGNTLNINSTYSISVSFVHEGTTYTTTTQIGTKSLKDLLDKNAVGGGETKAISTYLKTSGSGNAIGKDIAGDTVYTADRGNALTLTAAKSGVSGQISGVTFSVTNTQGAEQKSINAVLDNFSESIRAQNKSDDNAISLQVGTKANQSIKVGLTDMRAEALGLQSSTGTTIQIGTQKQANAAINVLDNAVQKALDQQTTIGAVQSRLSYTSSNLTTASENVQSSESTIRDADMAKEMTEYTKNNVLLQAAQSMLAQANQSSSSVLSLLQ